MSLVKAKHNLLYTEATEFVGSIKHNMVLPHFREEQKTAECNRFWNSWISKALPSPPHVEQFLQSLKSQEHQGHGGNRLPLQEKEIYVCASVCMEQQEHAGVLASDLTASVFRKEHGRWFSWTSTGIWATNCVALLHCNHSSEKIRLFRWSLPCVYKREISFFQIQNLSQCKASVLSCGQQTTVYFMKTKYTQWTIISQTPHLNSWHYIP